MVRGRLLKLWRAARLNGPGRGLGRDRSPRKRKRDYQSVRGLGGFVRASWDEVNEIVAAANVYTIKKYGPDRIIGFSPIPAMSMILRRRQPLPVPDRRRLHELLRLVLRPAAASPQIWGEQTDVPESADWYNSTYIIAWGSNVPQTRTPDAHFFTEVRYKGTKTVAVTRTTPSGQARRHLDAPQAGHRRRRGHGHGPRDPEGVLLPRSGKPAARTSTTTRAATPTCRCW
jgi:nitrate reductase alpha subunit